MFEITADKTIREVLDHNRALARVFTDFGMHCLFCPSATMESLGEAAQVHGINVDELIAQLEAADTDGAL